MEVLYSIKYIEFIHTYTYENELVQRLQSLQPDIRFLGDDYRGRTIYRFELNTTKHYLNRDERVEYN